jgi:fatty acid CoA ligase FadD9
MLSPAQTEKLLARAGDLLANDEQFRAALPSEEVATAMLRPGIGLIELMQVVVEGYADRPALGQRATEQVVTGGRRRRVIVPRYDTVTYRDLWRRVTGLSAALGDQPVRPGDRVATLGSGSIDYTTVDMAVAVLGAVSVPLHAGAPVGQLQPVVDETAPSVLACSAEHLGLAVQLALDGPATAMVLVFDGHPDVDDHRAAIDAARDRLAGAGGRVALETMAGVLDRGRDLPAPPSPRAEPERLAAIIYTSGSSGSPKGAMQPESLLAATWSSVAAAFVERKFALPAITSNYLPMSHTGGRAMLYSTLGVGGTAYFAASSDLSTLLEDLALVRPTQLNLVPRVWELLHREFVHRLRPTVDAATEEEVLADLRSNVLGGRYLTALTGSAPISEELAAWVERLLDMHLMDALGATESGSVIVDGQVQRPPITDYKLGDVPELGYFSTDRPHPRGELLIKSTSLFRGYYRRDDLTAEVFDADGFYRTGDVVAELGPDRLRYVDRRNNVLKLSQGEFVTVSRLEAVYGDSELVRQVYVYGNSERPYVLAVVVPTDEAIARHRSDLKAAVLRSLQDAAVRAGLQSYEIPRDVIVETEPFTLDNGLLTGVGKPARRKLDEHYGKRLEALYAEHARAQDDLWRELSAGARHQPVLETVCRAAAAVLGGAAEAPSPEDHFAELGGDSLSALSYASALSDLLGVDVPVDVVTSPANDLQAIADHIEARRRPGGAGPTFASVHGEGATTAHAGDLSLDAFLDAVTLAGASSLPAPSLEARHVFLTGATGYLGRYLALEWLERMARVGGTVTCLVRAKDDAAARARLDAVFDSGDDELMAHYRTLAADHLEVVAGDKSQDSLGLEKTVWQRLAEAIEVIVDPAALVNHKLPYPQLFGPNVVGTAELIRLALTARMKPVVHVSSVAVGATVPPGELSEDADVRQMSPRRQVDDAYASGYATSKWAGEVLLREAHDLCGLPVRVFRCSMLMAEPTRRGQLNLPDTVTRLILSLAATGLAPESFYIRKRGAGRARAHFDGLPIDFVAETISTLGSDPTADYRTYHVVNPHDDGIGLDDYVDWMIEAGCRIQRISDHDQWYERFESALRNLPDRQRQASLLPIVATYRHPQTPAAGAFTPAPRFQSAVEEFALGADGAIPHISKPTIVKYLTDLELLGLLDPNDREERR